MRSSKWSRASKRDRQARQEGGRQEGGRQDRDEGKTMEGMRHDAWAAMEAGGMVKAQRKGGERGE